MTSLREQPPFRLGLDLDGVLCNFTRGFLGELASVTGRAAPSDYVQRTWSDWHDYKASEVSQAWQRTHAPFWWQQLTPLDVTNMSVRQFLMRLWLQRQHIEVVFITTRPAMNARQQSIAWLERHGMLQPQVIVAPSANAKAAICDALALDAFVDDYWVNLQAIQRRRAEIPEASPTLPVLYCQPYNEPHRGAFLCVEGLPALWREIAEWARLPSFTGVIPQAR